MSPWEPVPTVVQGGPSGRGCAACRARMAAGERRNVITVVFAHIVWALDRSERLDSEFVRWAVQRWSERGGRGWLGVALRTRWRDDGGWWACGAVGGGSGGGGAVPADRDEPVRVELVHESERSRVSRLFLPGRTLIR